MLKTIKKVIAEVAGVSVGDVTGDCSLRDDLDLSDGDIDDIVSEIEEKLDIELYGNDDDFIYVSDIIAYVKQSL